jgi:ABC-type antimicrobial peptide transport system permease subunit
MIRTFLNLRALDLGFDPEQVTVARMSLQGVTDPSIANMQLLQDRVLGALDQLPGSTATAVTNSLPAQTGLNLPILIPEREEEPGPVSVDWRYASPGLFEALRMEVVQGRPLTETDGTNAPAVAVVNEAFARRYFPGGQILDRRLELFPFAPEATDPPRTIVGVVKDTRGAELGTVAAPAVYVPAMQVSAGLQSIIHQFFQVAWVVRASPGSRLRSEEIREAFRSILPSVPLAEITPMAAVVGTAIQEERFQMVLLATFAGLALVMATAGIYGLMAYSVRLRRRDFALRMALGADDRRIFRMVTLEGLTLAGVGLALGIAGAAALTRLFANLLFGVQAGDPATFLLVAVGILLVTTAATAIPTIRLLRQNLLARLQQ